MAAAMRYWLGFFVAVVPGCQSAPPATLAPPGLQPPLSATMDSASPASTAKASAKGSDVRLASFESAGKTEIEVRMPRRAQAEPVAPPRPALAPKPLNTTAP